MNLIYVSQDNVYEIPPYLMMPIFSLELPSDSLRLRQSIGNGEFGRVHIGDAQGVNGTEDWTTVAIKTLAGLPPLIKLMIQCFSAYTTKRPFTNTLC